MDDFQSSDVEFDPPPPNPFRDAGKASIQRMRDHAVEDRIASKKQIKQLEFVAGSPSKQYNCALWWNRLQDFRKNTLLKDLEEPPQCEELERFFTTIVSRVVPLTNQVPSYTWLKNGVGHIIDSCVFYHKTFTLSPHERSRIATHLHSLFQEGKLTKDPSWERAWAGVVIVRKLICSLIDEAFEQGTPTWDITIAKCLSIAFVSALGVRAGDVTAGPRDQHTLPYLVYKDVVIKLKGGSTIDDLEAVVNLRNEKGDKLDPKKKRVVLLRAQKSPSDSLMCPIKLLLTLALRLGNVAETSIDDLLLHTSQRRNGTVLWSFPERPVFCAFISPGTGMDVDKSAANRQLTQILGQASLAAGLLGQLHGHDLRRGAARDTANLSGKGKGLANKMTAAALGHGAGTASRALTAHYVGSHDDDVWTKRVDANYVDSINILAEAESPYQRKFHAFTTQEITEACLREGLDHNQRKDRATASKKLEKRRQADWAEQESRKRQMLALDSPRTPSLPADDFTAESQCYADDITTEIIAPIGIALDPELAQQSYHAELICNVIFGAKDDADHPTFQSLMLDSVRTGAVLPTAQDFKTGDTLSFVRHFSTINITCNQGLQKGAKSESSVAARNKILARLQGNSRAAVTVFIYSCKNRIHGCTYGNGSRTEVTRHGLRCPIISSQFMEVVAAKEAAKTFLCAEDGCSVTFDSAWRLDRHVRDVHQWPKPCPKGCEAMMFESRLQLNTHLEIVHSNFAPSKCLYPGCESHTVFDRQKYYRQHIRQFHKIMGKAIDAYMPN